MKSVTLRLFEMLMVGILLIAFAPFMLMIAVLIVVDSGLPVLYLSSRVGKNGIVFKLYYFRTMQQGATSPESRLTRVGRFLRNYSLDHLPQVFNLLRGDMHLIGPRPMMPYEVVMENENYRAILNVKPGIFSPAIVQLGKHYNSTNFATKIKLEKEYLAKRSIGSDGRLIKQTLQAIIKSKGNIKKHGEFAVTQSKLEDDSHY